MSEQKLTTLQVLNFKFTANGEAVIISEVPCHPIGGGRIDYMIINMWASRGYAIHGIEKKSFRSDWLRELKNPAKQEKHFKYCDRFWLLTDKENVAKLEEIPETWGWYHINKNGILKVMKDAPKLEAHPIDRFMLCSMLRRAGDRRGYVHEDELEQRIEERATSLDAQKKNIFDWKVKDYDELIKKVEEFEKSSGVKLSSWSHTPEEVGKALRLILDNKIEERIEYITRIRDNFQNLVNQISESIKSFD